MFYMTASNTGYCVRCKAKKPMLKAKKVTTKNERAALKGECKTCGTTMMKFIKS